MAAPHIGPRRLRRLGASLLPILGALLPACAGDSASASPEPKGAQQQQELPAFDAARAWRHLEAQVAFGPRPSGSAALEGTRGYLEQQLRAAGLEPVREAFTADTPKGPIEMVNVYADLPGAARDGEAPPMVILASHFDTKRMDAHPDPAQRGEVFLGANDGASSTAVLLELARVLAAAPKRPVSYRFLFLDGEEAVRWDWSGTDNCYGSRHHADQLRRSGEFRDVGACVVLDMVGDKELTLTSDTKSTPELLELFFSVARRNGLGEHVGGRRIDVLDDHTSFRRVGIPAVDLIDLDYVGRDATGVLRDWWHTPEDTIDKCSPESLAVIGRIVLLGLPELETFAARPRR